MATIGNIEWYRGDSYGIELTMKDKTTSEAIDITGYSFIMTVNSTKDPSGISTQMFQVIGVVDPDQTVNKGKVTLTPTTVQTDIPKAKYYYDVQMTDASDNVRTIAKYEMKILQDITKVVDGVTEYGIQFDDSDLTSNVLTVVHGLGEMYPVVTVYNDSDELVSVTVVPIDVDSYTIDFGGAISGTWYINTRVLPTRYTESFTDADLVANVLTVTHGLGTAYPAVSVYDNNNELARVSVVSTSTTTFTIDFFGTITGTWHCTVI